MPATTTRRPIQYSRLQRMEGQASFLRAEIAECKEITQYAREGKRWRRMAGTCGEREMQLALDAMKRHPGTSFDDCLVALRAG